ncbi:MAG: Gfo/Idh/MocA family oxidoreductase [Clostridia bacterium]|nr:Gfo/Idh/MocA family oxidoreductase [Clostridia bacterium]MBP5270098.1 Gfo/Idh/MocA family oxidoreductase [Clostridia bacterium]
MDTVRLGIIGVGNIGSTHFKSVTGGKVPGMKVAAIADRRPERLAWAKEYLEEKRGEGCEIDEPAAFSEGADLISSGLCDAVIVSVPHYQHPGLAIDAFRHGLHVMCEKPAGVYTLQVREMTAEADLHPELVFGMMFNQRPNPVYSKMRQIIASGELGRIRRTSWIVTDWYRPQYYYDSGDWRATWSGEGGGVLLNQCPHQLDLWQWICGMPVRISARMEFGKWHDIEVEDDVSVYCEYANGATGTFITSTGDTPGTNRFEIVCDGGTLVAESKTLTLYKLSVPEPEYSRTNRDKVFGKPDCEKTVLVSEGKSSGHVAVLTAFAGAILRGEPLVADGREGINGLTISNAIHLSAFLGREVEIPFDEKLFYDELMKRVATSRRKTASAGATGDTEGTY